MIYCRLGPDALFYRAVTPRWFQGRAALECRFVEGANSCEVEHKVAEARQEAEVREVT